MKNILMITILGSVGALSSCNGGAEGEKSTTTATQEVAAATGKAMSVDAATSQLIWEGSAVGHGHKGAFPITTGSLNVENGNITGGNFEINVKGISTSDAKGKDATDLIGHLSSPDFFDAAKFPTAKFAITKVEALKDSVNNATISGNLTLKDSTVNVTFPAKVVATDSNVSANAKFVIDRSKWGMKYGADKSLGDKFISPEVGITISLMAK
jgi:polyisoprenoid-binding protein YceI